MSEPTRTSRAPADKRLTYQQWKRRKMLRLARNWVLFLAGCAAVVALLTGGILWLLPKVHRRRGHRPAAGGRSCHAVSQYGRRRAGGWG